MMLSFEAVMGFLDVIVNGWLWATPYQDASLAEPYIQARRERAERSTPVTMRRLRHACTPRVPRSCSSGAGLRCPAHPHHATTPPPIGVVLEEANRAFDGPRETENRMVAYTAFSNITGLPAVSLPVHMTESGLPVGAQLIGRPFGEAELIRLGSSVEAGFRMDHPDSRLVSMKHPQLALHTKGPTPCTPPPCGAQ